MFADRIEALEDSAVELAVNAATWCRAHGGAQAAVWASCPCGEWAIVFALACGVDPDRCLVAAARVVAELAEEWNGDPELLELATRTVRAASGDDAAELTDDECSDLEAASVGVDDPARAVMRGLLYVSIGMANKYLYEAAWAVQQVTRGLFALGYSTAQAGEITADIVRREIGLLAAHAPTG